MIDKTATSVSGRKYPAPDPSLAMTTGSGYPYRVDAGKGSSAAGVAVSFFAGSGGVATSFTATVPEQYFA